VIEIYKTKPRQLEHGYLQNKPRVLEKINLSEKILKSSTNFVAPRKNTHDEEEIYKTKPREKTRNDYETIGSNGPKNR